MYEHMDKEMKMMIDSILEEMGRIEERTNKRFDKIEAHLESVHQEVNACKLERESISMLLKKIDELEKKSA